VSRFCPVVRRRVANMTPRPCDPRGAVERPPFLADGLTPMDFETRRLQMRRCAGNPCAAQRRALGFAVGLLITSACTSTQAPQTASGGTIAYSRAAFAAADAQCRAAGKVAAIRYVDRHDDTLTFDCVRP
jgi:hypothetical protein